MKDPYVYEGTGVLKNKLGIRDADKLREAEANISFVKLFTVDRDVECGKFDLDYLRRIHKYVLGDIFDWAGEFRTVPMEKEERVLNGKSVEYAYPTQIKKMAQKYLDEINRINWNEINIDGKSELFTKLISALWQVHPFRDGNTRTVITYAFRFAKEHGFDMDRDVFLKNFNHIRESFVMASIGQYSEYQYLNNAISTAIRRGNNFDDKEGER